MKTVCTKVLGNDVDPLETGEYTTFTGNLPLPLEQVVAELKIWCLLAPATLRDSPAILHFEQNV